METVTDCDARVTLEKSLLDQIEDFDGVYGLQVETYYCALVLGHEGCHLSLGDEVDGDKVIRGMRAEGTWHKGVEIDWRGIWVAWTDPAQPELLLIEPCSSSVGDEEDDPRGEEICLLPDHHVGLHNGGDTWWDDAGRTVALYAAGSA